MGHLNYWPQLLDSYVWTHVIFYITSLSILLLWWCHLPIRNERHTTFISLVLFVVIWGLWGEIEITTYDCSNIYIYMYGKGLRFCPVLIGKLFVMPTGSKCTRNVISGRVSKLFILLYLYRAYWIKNVYYIPICAQIRTVNLY